MVQRKSRKSQSSNRKKSGGAFIIGLFLVAVTTFLQNIIDLLQSYSSGAYMPVWQRILIFLVLFLSMLGVFYAYNSSRGGVKRLKR